MSRSEKRKEGKGSGKGEKMRKTKGVGNNEGWEGKREDRRKGSIKEGNTGRLASRVKEAKGTKS